MNYLKSIGLPADNADFLDYIAVKAIGDDCVKGYCALWGDPDKILLDTDFFTGQKSPIGATDFWEATTPLPRPLVCQPPGAKHPLVVGQVTDIGEDDEGLGLWFQAQLDRANLYKSFIEKVMAQRQAAARVISAPQYTLRQRKGAGLWVAQHPRFVIELCEPEFAGLPTLAKSVDLEKLNVGLLGQSEHDWRVVATMTPELKRQYLDAKFQDLINFYEKGE